MFSRLCCGGWAVSSGALVGEAHRRSVPACGISCTRGQTHVPIEQWILTCCSYHGSPRVLLQKSSSLVVPFLSFGLRFSCPRMLLGLSPSSLHQGDCVDALYFQRLPVTSPSSRKQCTFLDSKRSTLAHPPQDSEAPP